MLKWLKTESPSLSDIGTKCPKIEMSFGEMSKGRINIGSKSPTGVLTLNWKITKNENFKDQNYISTKYTKVEMIYGEMSEGLNNIGSKSPKVEMVLV